MEPVTNEKTSQVNSSHIVHIQWHFSALWKQTENANSEVKIKLHLAALMNRHSWLYNICFANVLSLSLLFCRWQDLTAWMTSPNTATTCSLTKAPSQRHGPQMITLLTPTTCSTCTPTSWCSTTCASKYCTSVHATTLQKVPQYFYSIQH